MHHYLITLDSVLTNIKTVNATLKAVAEQGLGTSYNCNASRNLLQELAKRNWKSFLLSDR